MNKHLPADYTALLAEIKERVRSAQYSALKAVNRELVGLYWDMVFLAQPFQHERVFFRLSRGAKIATTGCNNRLEPQFDNRPAMRRTARTVYSRKTHLFSSFILPPSSFASERPQNPPNTPRLIPPRQLMLPYPHNAPALRAKRARDEQITQPIRFRKVPTARLLKIQ